MSHPPYQLRSNKAIDRLLFVQTLRRLGTPTVLRQYTYYGFGGPFLEDYKVLAENFPELNLVSFERDRQTYKRQKFHIPCAGIRLRNTDFSTFLAAADLSEQRAIYWLDFTSLEYGRIADFIALLEKISPESIVKITLRADPRDYKDAAVAARFGDEFRDVLPQGFTSPALSRKDFTAQVQNIVQIAALRALPPATPMMFQPLSSYYYADGANMLTLTGIVCARTDAAKFRTIFQEIDFANLEWRNPMNIDVPFLTTKERLHLQQHLPSTRPSGRRLQKKLGYLIEKRRADSIAKLNQYSHFHRYYPHFIKAIP